MKKPLITLLISAIISLYGCVPDPSDEGKDYYEDTLETPPPSAEVARDTSITIKAKFKTFQFGDVSHYLFEDSEGYEWDFAGNEDKTYAFEMEVAKDKQNESNQGWMVNDEYVGKWFNLTYFYRVQPKYTDGPMEKAMIIRKVDLIEK
jgi:hypothetical protein